MSINPNDYEKRSEKRAISCFRELYEDGGYIWAEYRTKGSRAKVGEVVPLSFRILEPTWSKGPRKGDVAKVKTLDIENVRIIEPYEAMSLRSARPRKGAMARWHAAKNRLQFLVEKSR